MISHLKRIAFGKDPYVTLEKRFQILMILSGILLGIAGSLINILLDFQVELIIIVSAIPVIFVFLLRKTITSESEREYSPIVGWILLIFFPFQWILNGGRDSNTTTLIFYAVTVLFFVLPSKRLYLIIFLLFGEFVILNLIDEFFPSIISPYNSPKQRFYDLILFNSISFMLLIYALTVIRDSYNFQIKKGEIHNAKLKSLNKQLTVKERELREYSEKLEVANQSKARIISILSHDLRSPFQSVLGLSEILATECVELEKVKAKEFSVLLYNALKNQYALLNDLLMWARFQGDTIEIDMREVVLSSLADEVLALFESASKQKHLILVNSVPGDVKIQADRNMLSVVLRNLVNNSIKFSNEGGKIEISFEKAGTKNIIRVSDEGIGIDQETLEKINSSDLGFTKPGTHGEKGTGLGLNLASEIIRRHNGTLTFKSEAGRGTTAEIILQGQA